MVKKIINEDIYSDNEGVSLGKVGSYVQRFKEQEKTRETIPFNPKKNFLKGGEIEEEDFPVKTSTKVNKVKVTQDPNTLPEKITEDNEKSVYVYYYCKFGNLDCDDFNNIKGKIASSINRLYGKNLTPQEALDKLEKYVTPADINLDQKVSLDSEKMYDKSKKENSNPKIKSKISINLEEKMYPFYRGLEPLTEEQKDLLMFVETKNLCFSSDSFEFFLTVKDKECFDNLFNFDSKENMVYEMFKEQLGDEYKAKKLVLMSRILNKEVEVSKPAASRKKKN